MRNAWSCHDGRADRVHYYKFARTYLAECYARTVIRVDIGGNLEDESGEFRFVRFHFTLFCLYGTRTRSNTPTKQFEQFLYTKIIQGRAEEYRCAISCQISFSHPVPDKLLRSVPDRHAVCLPAAHRSAYPVLP